MTIKEEILKKYANKFTFEDAIKFMREHIFRCYEVQTEWFGFDFSIEDITKPFSSTTNHTDAIITFHLPHLVNLTDREARANISEWFKSEGFEWTESNNQCGFRIKFNN